MRAPSAASSAHLLIFFSTFFLSLCSVPLRCPSAPPAGRDVFVGSEVCVTLFDQEYTFLVSQIDQAATEQKQRQAHDDDAMERKEEKQPLTDIADDMQRLRVDDNGAAASTAFPQLYSVSSSTRILLADSRRIAADSKTDDFLPSDVIDADAIGGLEAEIASLRELISLPLIQPHLFSTFALKPPKGILLYGPPGTGQSHTIRRAVGAELRQAQRCEVPLRPSGTRAELSPAWLRPKPRC